jgi:hypothetical protein
VLFVDRDAVLLVDELGGKLLEDLGFDHHRGDVDDGHMELLADGLEDFLALQVAQPHQNAVETLAGASLLLERGVELIAIDQPA